MNNIARIPLKGGRSTLTPTRVVVHAMAEFVSYGGREYYATEWLAKRGLSAHILVTPSNTIIRCRDNDQGAYHALAQGHNEFSLGIEFLVSGVHDITSLSKTIKKPYLSEGQLETGIEFVRDEWVKGLGVLDYVRHTMIDPLNKQDPGEGFPWDIFLRGIGVII